MKLNLDQIRLDGKTQSRAELNQQTVFDYAEVAKDSNQDWPFNDPVIVFHDGSDYWLADGFHRWHGMKEAERDSVEAEVRQGSARDAFLCAASSNVSHGLRRTNRDKRFIVARFLSDPTWKIRSDRWIAEKAMVGKSFVSNVRNQMSLNVSDSQPTEQKTIGKDGKARRQPRRTRKPKTAPPISTIPEENESVEAIETTVTPPRQPQKTTGDDIIATFNARVRHIYDKSDKAGKQQFKDFISSL